MMYHDGVERNSRAVAHQATHQDKAHKASLVGVEWYPYPRKGMRELRGLARLYGLFAVQMQADAHNHTSKQGRDSGHTANRPACDSACITACSTGNRGGQPGRETRRNGVTWAVWPNWWIHNPQSAASHKTLQASWLKSWGVTPTPLMTFY